MVQETIPAWLAYGACFAVVLLLIALFFSMRKEGDPSSSTVFQRWQGDYFNPLTRQDLVKENNWTLEDQWTCYLCEFKNHQSSYCALCGTECGRKLQLSEGPTPSMSKHTVLNMNHHEEEIQESGHDPPPLVLDQLSLRQKMARMRKEWTLDINLDGKQIWTRNLRSKTQHGFPTLDGLVAKKVTVDDRSAHHRLTFTECSETTSASLEPIRGYELTCDELMLLEHMHRQEDFHMKYAWFLAQMTDLMSSLDEGRLRLRIHRHNLVMDSIEQLVGISQEHLHLQMRIEFMGESGVDAGGLEREWVAVFAQQIFDTRVGLFHDQGRKGVYTINPHSASASVDHLVYFRGIGRFIGRVLLNGQLLPIRLALPLFKHMLGTPLTFGDLEFFDPQLFQNLEWIQNHEGVDDLALDFSVVRQRNNDDIWDLKPHGRDIPVTDANKEEYILLYFKYIMLGSIADQLQSLLLGLFEIIPQEILMVFDYQELELVICGAPEIDIADWKRYTYLSADLVGSDLIVWFWEILTDMSHVERARLLQFATGSSHVPAQGFQALTSYDGRLCPFMLKGIPLRRRTRDQVTQQTYPKAHTCFNRIDLPVYDTKEQLNQVLHDVIQADITGFTIE